MIKKDHVRYFSLFAAVFLAVMPMVIAAAGTRSGVDFKLNCTGFTSHGGQINFNRDNTGTGREAYRVTAIDGHGNTLYEMSNSYPLGAGLTFDSSTFTAWTTAPAANPLILIISSVPGNDLAEQVLYRRTDDCSRLNVRDDTAVEITGLLPIADADEMGTAPSVPLNEPAPRPVTINDLGDTLGLSGYGIVNTSRLFVRSGAGVEYAPVAVLNGGTEVVMLGRNDNDTWWYIEADQIRGWVNVEFLILRGDVSSAPTLPEAGELDPVRFVTFSPTVLYGGTNTTNGLCLLPASQEFAVIGRDSEQRWFEVQASCDGVDVTGWVEAQQGAIRNSGARFISVTTN